MGKVGLVVLLIAREIYYRLLHSYIRLLSSRIRHIV